MMTSNLLARFRSATEPAATSIYQTIRQHDDDTDGSDVEERAGLARSHQDPEDNLSEPDAGGPRIEIGRTKNIKQGSSKMLGKQRDISPRIKRKAGRLKRVAHGRELVDVEEGDDDVPASLLIEGTEGVLPHEIENLPPPPHETSPKNSANERAQLQWAQAQAAQELHPTARATLGHRAATTSPAYTPLAAAAPKEKAMWRWVNVQNLDNFLLDVYDYYLNHGFWSIILQRLIGLFSFAFIFGFFLFLTQCINYRKIKESTQLPQILVQRCTYRMGFLPNLLLWFATFLWIYKAFQYIVDIRRLTHLRDFYQYLLGVPEDEIQSISWQEIVSRLMALRDSNPNVTSGASDRARRFLGTQNKQRMDAHDIANRLMRRENYMVAMINKDILDMTLPIPGLRNKQLFTRTLEWNLNQCITQYVFNSQGQIRQLFLKDTHRRALSEGLKRRFIFAGTMSLISAPFLIAYFILQNFFQHFNEFQKNPAQIGLRRYNVLAEWKFREFNELWHLFQRRLNMSRPFATRYINQFPKDKTVQVARFTSLVSGAIVSILGLATVLDQESFLSFEITSGRTTIFYLGVFGGIWAVARGLLPDDYEVYDSSFSMEEVIDFTHYRPAHWDGRLHTAEVKTEFAQLYQMQVVILFEELLSMVFTPFVLWFSLPKCSDHIIDFFREFTVHVDGVGYVCSFAEFNFRKPGNTIPSSANTRAKGQVVGLRDDYFATKDHKLEQSYWGFMNDYGRNPKTDVRFPYKDANLNRRLFNLPPPVPGLPSPQLNPNVNNSTNVMTLATGRQSHLFSPSKSFGIQPATSRFANQSNMSPLQSMLLDPHHQPSGTNDLGKSATRALRSRNSGPSGAFRQQKSTKNRPVSQSFRGLEREGKIDTTITEDPDVPPTDLTGGALADQTETRSRHDEAEPIQSLGQMSNNVQSEAFESWNKAEDNSENELDNTDGAEDDVAALTGEGAGVLGLIRQFQRAQGEGTRTGTGIQ